MNESLQVRPGTENNWTVIDEQDQACFSGTWIECEEWLDLRENLMKQQAKRSWSQRLTSWMRSLWSSRSANNTLDSKLKRKSVSATTD